MVATTLGVLGSGLALIVLGPNSGRRAFLKVLGQSLDVLTLHQALFIAFAAVTGLHLLAPLVPAVTLATGRVQGGIDARGSDPGRTRRGAGLLAVLVTGAVTAVLFVARRPRGRTTAHDSTTRAASVAARRAMREVRYRVAASTLHW